MQLETIIALDNKDTEFSVGRLNRSSATHFVGPGTSVLTGVISELP